MKGRKNILIMTLIASGVAYAVMGCTASVTIIVLIRAVLGM